MAITNGQWPLLTLLQRAPLTSDLRLYLGRQPLHYEGSSHPAIVGC